VTEKDKPPGHAFICYVHEDSRRVNQLQRTLEVAGISVWRDKDNLWPGEDWREKIRDAITNNTLVFVACFSQHSISRMTSYQNEELTLAIEEMRKRSPEPPWLIPIRFDDCKIPDRDIGGGRTLSSIHRADMFGPGARADTKRLVEVMLRVFGRSSGQAVTARSSGQPMAKRSGPEHSSAKTEDPKHTEAPPSAEGSMDAGNLAAFCEQLRDLQRRVGMPTLMQLRALMEPAPGVSTLSALLRGKLRRAPRWELVSGLVTACISHAASNGIQLDGPETELMTWRRRHEELLGLVDASIAQQHPAFADWGARPSAIAGGRAIPRIGN
jgi:TIR domain